ncbi:hypothetical protein MAMC_00349 [Methylacidimicrobium cyclopophantes]|uniref:Phosphatidic acid phosphatase type 2/haloperoxidase domain-containing protein n=1 Tax=Methylacidimicrobium cyclopophantes TaxID=1041766 RepID=A0A5E6M9J8_9BACT|nr:phosphatase PAP2 family protein [Methylacidimicrobium cyclopophantes]VVM04978.1 hypothetical protein MAMC_00349 [Methylacidimicrobium cyclopophantes]
MGWDLWLFYEINTHWTCPFLDRWMPVVSHYHHFQGFVLVGVLLLTIFGRFRERCFLGLVGISLVVGDMGVTDSLKHLVNRPRPFSVLAGVREVDEGKISWSDPSRGPQGRSFPSGHAANNAALAYLANAFYGPRMAWVWLWAGLVGYSRVYLGVHYPSDVLAGWLVGTLYAWALSTGAEYAWHRWGKRLFPHFFVSHPRLLYAREKKRGETKEEREKRIG